VKTQKEESLNHLKSEKLKRKNSFSGTNQSITHKEEGRQTEKSENHGQAT
jgi:hypothetical protein